MYRKDKVGFVNNQTALELFAMQRYVDSERTDNVLESLTFNLEILQKVRRLAAMVCAFMRNLRLVVLSWLLS